MALKSFKLNPAVRHIVLPFAAVFLIVSAGFALKWYLGNAVSANAAQKEIAEIAVVLAPSDPQSHYALAVLSEKSFLPEDLPKSIEEFEKAAALAPNDYRLWLALGRARDRLGETEAAERALRRALELAPNYAQVHWTLGNVLLRQGKTAEALAEIRRAVDGDETLAVPAVASVWQVLNTDTAEITKNIGDSPRIKAALASLLAKEKRFDEAMRLWNEFSAADKRDAFKKIGEEIFNLLVNEKKFADALRVRNDISEEGSAQPAAEKFTNGGFENPLVPDNVNLFDWQIGSGAQPLIGPNNEQKRSGNQSLFMIFNSANGKDWRTVSQTLVVAPERNYTFQVFYRSDLKASGTLKWEIADAVSGRVLASTEAVRAQADWTPLTAKFTTASETEAIIVRLVRESCATPVCPISGKIWFDDFSLEK